MTLYSIASPTKVVDVIRQRFRGSAQQVHAKTKHEMRADDNSDKLLSTMTIGPNKHDLLTVALWIFQQGFSDDSCVSIYFNP